MQRLLRLAAGLLVLVLVCGGVGAGVSLKLQADAEAARDARIAVLAERLPAIRAQATLAPADACALAEHHVLTRRISRALAATCDAPAFEPVGSGGGRLTGLVWGADLDNALFGGGHANGWCLGRTAAGWEVIGDDWTVRDCVMDVSAGDAAAVAASAQAGAASRQREIALATIEAVRAALAAASAPPDACAAPEPGAAPTVTLTTATLAGRPGVATERRFGFGTSGCVEGGPAPAETRTEAGATAAALHGACGLDAPPDRVLVLDLVEVPPVAEGDHAFSGGRLDATLRVVELPAGRVACARPVAFQLPDEVLTYKSSTLQVEYDKGVKRALCAGVAALGGARLDPWWECPAG